MGPSLAAEVGDKALGGDESCLGDGGGIGSERSLVARRGVTGERTGNVQRGPRPPRHQGFLQSDTHILPIILALALWVKIRRGIVLKVNSYVMWTFYGVNVEVLDICLVGLEPQFN